MLLTDSGDGDLELRRILADAMRDGEVEPYLRAVTALCGARLFMAFVDRREPGARRPELGAVSLESDGVRRLLAFTGRDSVTAWNPASWPQPATLDELAATAVEAQASELLVDVAGPVPFVVGDDLVVEIARGRRLVELGEGGFGWAELNHVTEGAEASRRSIT